MEKINEIPELIETPAKKATFLTILIRIIFVLVIIIVFIIAFYPKKQASNEPLATPTPTVSSTVENKITTTGVPLQVNTLFENSSLSITVKKGWGISELEGGALNISKNNYVLYINPSYQQSSSVEGGKFDEISTKSPSAELVIQAHPAIECGPVTQTKILLNKYTRYDLYVDGNANASICNPPTDRTTRWYLSYFVTKTPYLNYYKEGETKSFIITLSYNETSLYKLPVQDSPSLAQIQNEVVDILGSLTLK